MPTRGVHSATAVHTPVGDTKLRKRLVVAPKQAEIVVRIFEAYANGKSSRNIAAMLNEEGIPSPGSA